MARSESIAARVAICAMTLSGLATAGTIFSSFLPGGTFTCCSGDTVSGTATTPAPPLGLDLAAAAFTPDETYNLTQIDVAFYNVLDSTTFDLTLTTDSGGVPGTAIETWSGLTAPSVSALGASSTLVETVSPVTAISLQRGQQYWIVGTPGDPTSWDVWANNSVSLLASAPGGTVAIKGNDEGAPGWMVFSLASGDLAFDVQGSTPEPSTLPVCAALLGFGYYLRRKSVGSVRS